MTFSLQVYFFSLSWICFLIECQNVCELAPAVSLLSLTLL
jgi:hypothetical protein